jgi:hypothetical protein
MDRLHLTANPHNSNLHGIYHYYHYLLLMSQATLGRTIVGSSCELGGASTEANSQCHETGVAESVGKMLVWNSSGKSRGACRDVS